MALLDRDAAGVNRTAETIGVEGREALAFTNDITDSFAVERTLDRVIDEWGRLDILVNNAGELREASLVELTDVDLEESLDINLRGDAGVHAGRRAPHARWGGRPYPLRRLDVHPDRSGGADGLRGLQGRGGGHDPDLGP